MKQKTIVLVLCAALALSLSACGSGTPAASDSSFASSAAQQVTMQQIVDANSFRSATLKSHTTLRMERISTNADGTASQQTVLEICVDGDGYMVKNNVQTTENGEIVWNYEDCVSGGIGYGSTTDGPLTLLFPERRLEGYWDTIQECIISVDTVNEAIVSQEVNGEVLTVTTRASYADYGPYLWENDAADVDELEYVYVCDAETLEMESISTFGISGDSRRLMEQTDITYSDEPLTLPDYWEQMANPETTRTLTLHMDGKVQSFTVGADSLFSIDIPAGYNFYANPEGTTLATDVQVEPGQDRELYVLEEKQPDAAGE
jgi:hypothetical protein